MPDIIINNGEQNTQERQEPTLLENVNAAINAITVGGQSYKIGSRSLTRADLKQLYAMRNDLIAQEAAENKSGLFDDCYVGVFDGR